MTELNQMSIADLHDLKAMVEQQIKEKYFEDDNFMNRTTTDDYIYIIRYLDGSYHIDYIGKRAYEKYIRDPSAVQIDCKTKNLFPTYKTLIRKEISYA